VSIAGLEWGVNCSRPFFLRIRGEWPEGAPQQDGRRERGGAALPAQESSRTWGALMIGGATQCPCANRCFVSRLLPNEELTLRQFIAG
jgi:hypothetical protein